MIGRLIQFAWMFLAFNVIVSAAWLAIVECLQRGQAPAHRGTSWSPRSSDRLSGRF